MFTKASHYKIVAASLIGAFILIVLFWYSVHSGDVYKRAVTGAIYELLALPSVAIGLAVPTVSLLYWYKQNLSFRSPFVYIAILSILTYVYLISRVS